MHSKPQVLCWITCDAVHIDPSTGKHTLLGVFSNIRGHQFPLKHPFMVWFLTLSDVATGTHRVRISMSNADTTPVPLIEREFESKGPYLRINLINEVRNLSFPTPGDYGLFVEVDDEILLTTNLTVSR